MRPTAAVLRPLVLITLIAVVTLMPSFDAFACLACKDSPNGWGFCRPGFQGGYEFCTTIVVDDRNGTTDCDLQGRVCYNGGTLVGNDCWWTDLNGNCLI